MSVKMREWQIEWGDQKIPVTSDMVVSALDKAISTLHHFLEINKVIRSDARLKADWEQGVLIVELVRDQFIGLMEIELNRKVNRTIPRGRKEN